MKYSGYTVIAALALSISASWASDHEMMVQPQSVSGTPLHPAATPVPIPGPTATPVPIPRPPPVATPIHLPKPTAEPDRRPEPPKATPITLP